MENLCKINVKTLQLLHGCTTLINLINNKHSEKNITFVLYYINLSHFFVEDYEHLNIYTFHEKPD